MKSKDSDQIRLQYKIVLLGDGGVGKTALIRRYCFNDFSVDTQMTIGLSFHSITLQAKQNDELFRIGLVFGILVGRNDLDLYYHNLLTEPTLRY